MANYSIQLQAGDCDTINVVEGPTPVIEVLPGVPLNITYTGGGGSGGGPERYQHSQSIPALIWTVNHNLGFAPVIQVYTVGGVRLFAKILHLSINQAQVRFNQAMTGYAIAGD